MAKKKKNKKVAVEFDAESVRNWKNTIAKLGYNSKDFPALIQHAVYELIKQGKNLESKKIPPEVSEAIKTIKDLRKRQKLRNKLISI